MSVLRLDRHPVEPRSREAFEEAVRALLEEMRAAPGALWADAARAFDDDPSYLVASEWRTQADADAWDASETARRSAEAIDVLLRADVVRRTFAS